MIGRHRDAEQIESSLRDKQDEFVAALAWRCTGVAVEKDWICSLD
jgi:hypothetical protein